jgi:CubicO group peptidase (beta-lactamase class C family)
VNEHHVEMNGNLMNVSRHLLRTAGVAAWLLTASIVAPGAPAQGPIPDSPTGRMAGALVELTGSTGEEAMQAFVKQHLPAAGQGSARSATLVGLLRRLRDDYPEARMRGLMKTGAHSGQIILHSDGSGRSGTVSYEVEPDPPHHLKSIAIEEGDGGHFGAAAHQAPPPLQRADSEHRSWEDVPPPMAERLLGFVEAFNSGDAEAMLSFVNDNMTVDFQQRRPDEEDRALYERLRGMIGELHEVDLAMDGDEVMLTATTSDHGDYAELLFNIETAPPHLIQSYSVSLQKERPQLTLPKLDMPQGVDRQEFSDRLDRYLAGLTQQGRFSGSVLVAREGEPLFERAYGLANRDAGVPNRPDTMFDLGSITKVFTKTAVGQLLRDGKLALDDTVLDHIPDYPNREAGGKMTVAHLVDHSSGLGDIFNERYLEMRPSLLAPRDFFPLFAGDDLSFEPGEGMQYSNAGYVLLGAIVEAASGQSYYDYIRDNIFEPAGMTRSGFVPRDGSDDGVAVGYSQNDSGDDEGELRSCTDQLPVRGCPAGSSASSAGDLLKFSRALHGGRLLGPDWTPWVYSGRAPGSTNPDSPPPQAPGGSNLAIGGGAPGVNTALERGGGWTVIVLANLDPPVAQDVARQVLRAARHLPQ